MPLLRTSETPSSLNSQLTATKTATLEFKFHTQPSQPHALSYKLAHFWPSWLTWRLPLMNLFAWETSSERLLMVLAPLHISLSSISSTPPWPREALSRMPSLLSFSLISNSVARVNCSTFSLKNRLQISLMFLPQVISLDKLHSRTTSPTCPKTAKKKLLPLTMRLT